MRDLTGDLTIFKQLQSARYPGIEINLKCVCVCMEKKCVLEKIFKNVSKKCLSCICIHTVNKYSRETCYASMICLRGL